jgi:CDP-glycerol glycerophosphotransferase
VPGTRTDPCRATTEDEGLRDAVWATETVSRARKRLAIRTRARTAWDELVIDRYAIWRSAPLRERTVLYESFGGRGVLDSPEAIFRYLLTQPDMADLEHVWALSDLTAYPEVTSEFAEHPRVHFVATGSLGYFKALATAKYLVNNATFQSRFAKREGQVYVNTWHGVPVKHMGVDMPDGGLESRNVTRNFLQADYLLSANAYMTDTMYRSAYRLQGVFAGAVIEEGAPRVDRLVQALADPEATRRRLREHGVDVGDRRIVLYAPTWRGESFGTPWVNAAQLLATVRELEASVDGEDVAVLLKVHQVIYDVVRERTGDSGHRRFLVPNSLPTSDVLAVTDVLVTDYSSIFCDFGPTGRPVVHFVPDLDDYSSTRGLYVRDEELPGPVCSTTPDLLKLVDSALAGDFGFGSGASADGLHPAFVSPQDGGVCERVVDVAMRDRPEADYRVLRDFGTEKEKLLVYLGSMKSQGITTSALNLLRHIDYDRFDVTAFYPFSRGRDRWRNMQLVDPRVRVVPRIPVFAATRRRRRMETKNLMVNGLPEVFTPEHIDYWTTEWQRMFGGTRFDHLVDFSGYGCYAPFLYSVVDAHHKSIWLHNDMDADMRRETVGRHLEDRLSAVFSTYDKFDTLVSVSRELNRVNKLKLAAYARPEQFTYALNTMDTDRVLRMAGLLGADDPAERSAHGGAPGPRTGAPARITVPTDNIAAATSALLEHYTARDLIREARSRARLNRVQTSADTVTFVSVGRLSPEKNHARLIKAFAKVHEKSPNTRLVVLGGGDLEPHLQGLVLSLGLSDAVTLAGQVDNPYAIMREADCFVLSSDYEGQPMVILEARTLGLPIVTTSFSSVRDSVPEDAGVVVPLSVEGVASGMRRFLAGNVPASRLDADEYNRRAMEQFYAAIGARS